MKPNQMNFKQALETYGVPVIALLAGVMFLVFGATKLVKVNTYPQTSAVITHIEMEPGVGEEPDNYRVTVRYVVDGATYEAELDQYKDSYHEGKQIRVRYNPMNPKDVTAMSTFSAGIVLAFGALMLVVGITTSVRVVRSHAAARRKRLEE